MIKWLITVSALAMLVVSGSTLDDSVNGWSNDDNANVVVIWCYLWFEFLLSFLYLITEMSPLDYVLVQSVIMLINTFLIYGYWADQQQLDSQNPKLWQVYKLSYVIYSAFLCSLALVFAMHKVVRYDWRKFSSSSIVHDDYQYHEII